MAAQQKKIVVGMSGGVDSSVAAYLLQQQGYEVIGAFMINWEDDAAAPSYRSAEENALSGCTWEQDYEDVRKVCDQLGIPYQTFNFVEEYRALVFDIFVQELKKGRTPNPDILCNQEIKFNAFVQKALQLEGVDGVATGHYAAIGEGELQRPVDANKDQTYFLHRIDPAVIPQVLFPLQGLTKDEVRAIALEQQFPNAEKKDSTGICFIGDIDYAEFIDQYLEKKPGDIQTTEGEVVGAHRGLHFYTIGQRRGIDIGGTGPYYVVEKQMDTNILVVTNDHDDPRLSQQECIASDMHWLVQRNLPAQVYAQVRYRQQAQPALVEDAGEGAIRIIFDQPQRAITPGQSVVLYDGNAAGDTVLGGAVIDQAT